MKTKIEQQIRQKLKYLFEYEISSPLGKNFLVDNGFMVDVSKSLTENIVSKTVKKYLKKMVKVIYIKRLRV